MRAFRESSLEVNNVFYRRLECFFKKREGDA